MIIKLGDSSHQIFRYPGGEIQVRLNEEAAEHIQKDNRVTIIARIRTPADIMALTLLASAIEEVSISAYLDLVLPYLPYARADRSFCRGDCVGLKAFGQVLASMSPWRVASLDVHNKHAAERHIPNFLNIDPTDLIKAAVRNFEKECDVPVCVLFPDEGARNRYHGFGSSTYHATKRRDPKTGEFLEFVVPELPGPTLIVDDICDGGGTFVGIAERAGGVPLGLYVTHGIFSKGSLSSHFRRVYCSDSFGGPTPADVTVMRIDPLLHVSLFQNVKNMR